MKRRTLLQMVFGAITLPSIKIRRPSYVYDWAEGSTDDPAGLVYGSDKPVTVDGKEVTDLPIRRLRTGSDGYVDYLVKRRGQFVVRKIPGSMYAWELVEKRIEGHVRY